MTNFSTDVKILAFLWNYRPEKGNDKIWGYTSVNEKVYCFWGRRGTDLNSLKAIKFKRAEHDDIVPLERQEYVKCKKGYIAQSLDRLGDNYPAIEKIYPGFVAHMRNQLMLARLSGSVIREGR